MFVAITLKLLKKAGKYFMKKIIIVGTLNQPFGSFPVATQSDDGITWDIPTAPFTINDAPTAVANDGTSIAIANARGYLSVSSDDLQTYSQVTVSDGFNISSLGYDNGDWIAVGQAYYNDEYGSYEANSDIAQIHKAPSAVGPWAMVWIHPQTNSFIYQLKRFTNAAITNVLNFNVWVVVGAVGTNGDAWYSIDDGATWNQVIIPTGVSRIYSVDFASVGSGNFWYWGTKDNLYKSETLNSTEWSEASIGKNTSIMDMVSDDNNIVVAGLNQLHSSQDGAFFNSQFRRGYVFDKVSRIQNDNSALYLAFMRSNLTQYTYLTSTNALYWDAHNNNVTVSGYTLSI